MSELNRAKKQRTVSVTLFRETGRYYTIESWRAPEPDSNGYLGPEDMLNSPDFRRISGGKVLVEADALSEFPGDENWGYPILL